MQFRHFAVLGTVLGATSVLGGAAMAQDARTVYLYNASAGNAQALPPAAKFAGWGSGSVRITRQAVDYEGGNVLEVKSSNFAEGARFDLNQPLDLAPYMARGFLRLRLRFQNAGAKGAGGPGGPGGGAPGGGPPGGEMPGGGFPGGGMFPGGVALFQMKPPAAEVTADATWQANAQFAPLPQFGQQPTPQPGGRMPGGMPGGGDMGVPAGPLPQEATVTELRVVLMREVGAMSARVKIDLNAVRPDANGWRLYTIPLNKMTITPGASGPLKRMVLTGDEEDTVFLAEAAIGVETGRMQISMRRPNQEPGTQMAEIEVKPGPITLIADVEAGSADAEVTWNFDADNVGNLTPADGGGGALPLPAAGGGAPGGMGDGNTPDQPVGPRIDARGLTATFTYPNEEQNYRVEVTVTDKSGAKKPVTSSMIVRGARLIFQKVGIF